MSELPKIYRSKIEKNFSNNKDYVYAGNTSNFKYDMSVNSDIEKFIDDLFKEDGFIFNKPLIIKTKDKTYDTAIIRKSNDRLYTLTEDIIKISDIVSIQRK